MERVFVTSDYSQFKHLDANRPVRDNHVQELVDKIVKNGLMDTIIFVSKDMEILDGQHRVEAFKRLNLPVHYVMLENASIDDCIAMNASQQSWSVDDYIHSFVQRRFPAYIKLQALREMFPELTINVFLSIIGSFHNTGLKKEQLALRNGELFYPFDKEEELLDELRYLAKFSFFRKHKTCGRSDIFYKAIAACYRCPVVDNAKLYDTISNMVDRMASFNNFRECLQSIEDIYNHRARKRLYLSTEVRKMLDDQKHDKDDVVLDEENNSEE